jgi:transposase-like protein
MSIFQNPISMLRVFHGRRYTLEFEQEAVRLVHGRVQQSAVADTLGGLAQPLDNWVKAEAAADFETFAARRWLPNRMRLRG